MPILPLKVGDLVKVAVIQQLHGQTCVNLLGYRVIAESATGDGYTELATVLTAANSVIPKMKVCQSNECVHVRLEMQKVYPTPMYDPVLSTLSAGAGSVVGACLPSFVAAVITKRTGLSGRAYRGRIYVGGIPSSFEDNSKLFATDVPKFQALGDVLASALVQGSWTFSPILLVRVTAGLWTGTGITSCLARDVLRAQRRREIGVGE